MQSAKVLSLLPALSLVAAAMPAASAPVTLESQLDNLINFPRQFSVGDPGISEQVAALLANSGSVGDPRVMPYYTGDPRVMPYYTGAPIQQVDQSGAQRPVQYAPMDYVAGDVTWFGIGRTTIATGGARQTIDKKPQRPMAPQSFRAPSTVQGLLLHEISIAGTNIFNASEGVPIEFFSEVSTAPQIVFPTIETSTGVQFVVSNPTAGDLTFSGAFFGAAVRR
jgi:hypothetical protein